RPQAPSVRFVEDNWESPTLGAWGLGWEVWLDGMEITQFPYLQHVGRLRGRDVFHQNEVEQSTYNFEHADVPTLLRHFDDHEKACKELLAAKLALPAYEQVLKASHTFNLLDARPAMSVTERQRYIFRVTPLG